MNYRLLYIRRKLFSALITVVVSTLIVTKITPSDTFYSLEKGLVLCGMRPG